MPPVPRGPRSPLFPFSPSSPGGPGDPRSPSSPEGPLLPGTPRSPRSPILPVGPTLPFTPKSTKCGVLREQGTVVETLWHCFLAHNYQSASSKQTYCRVWVPHCTEPYRTRLKPWICRLMFRCVKNSCLCTSWKMVGVRLLINSILCWQIYIPAQTAHCDLSTGGDVGVFVPAWRDLDLTTARNKNRASISPKMSVT